MRDPEWWPLFGAHPQPLQQLGVQVFADAPFEGASEQGQLSVSVAVQKLVAVRPLVQHRDLLLGV